MGRSEKSKSSKTKGAKNRLDDDVLLRIQQEVEEFLKDLTLEFPFSEIFEILRRYEFKDRYGSKVSPMPKKGLSSDGLTAIDQRIRTFFEQLKKEFGSKYVGFIEESFRVYTQTTREP